MIHLRQRVAELLSPRLFAWSAFLIPVFAFTAPKISYWPLVLGGIGGLARYAAMGASPPRSMRPLCAWVLVMLLWIGLSSAYAIDTQAGLVLFLKLAGYGASGLLLIWIALEGDADARRANGLGHLIGIAAIVAAMSIDAVTSGAVSSLLFGTPAVPGGINLNATATTYLALIAWPLFVWLRDSGRAWTAILLPVLAVVFAWTFGQYAVVVALSAGAMVFGMTMVRPRAAAIMVAVLSAGFVLLAPLTGQLAKPVLWLRSVPPPIQFSAYHRVKIWEFSAKRIAERPIAGWGIDASRRIPGGNTRLDINRDLQFKGPNNPEVIDRRYRGTVIVAMPLHPHNAALQVWLELGLIGAFGLAVLCASVPLACRRATWPRASMAAGLAVYTTAYVVAMLSFSLWQSRWNALLWLIAASTIALLHTPSRSKDDDNPAV